MPKTGRNFGLKDAITVASWITLSACLLSLIIFKFGLKSWGLSGDFYSGTNFEKPLFSTSNKTISFVHALEMDPRTPSEFFSIHWHGTLIIPQEGTYTISVLVDDGFRLQLDDVNIFDEWADHDKAHFEKALPLSAGPHKIRLDYFNRTNSSVLKLYWKKPGRSQKEIIPAWALRTDAR